MIKKALIVYRINKARVENTGIVKKLLGQILSLRELGIKTDYVIHDDKRLYLNEQQICAPSMSTSSIIFKLKFYSLLRSINFNKYDLIIFRYSLSTLSFIRLLRDIHNSGSSSLVLLEMPTYPYEKEWTGIQAVPVMIMDKFFRRNLKKYVRFILHSGSHRQIFGIPTIRMSNGMRPELVTLKSDLPHEGINLIALGKWNFWHGLDRLLRGLKEYQGSIGVYLYIVGQGPFKNEIQKLTHQYNLQDRVFFKGAMAGEALDKLFDICDLGVGTLGLHRKGVNIDSSLKHREYVLRGLPFILSGTDYDIKNDQFFIFHVSSDESKIEIDRIVEFVRSKEWNLKRSQIRQFGQDHLSWTKKWKRVIKLIEEQIEKN